MPLKVKKTDDASINLTPLIDIVFLLIIFFMVGTKFSELNEMEKNIPLQVPTVSDATALTSAPQKRVINVLKDGQIVLDGRNVSLEQLREEIVSAKSQYQDLGVVIRGDGSAAYQKVTDVIATCKHADINDLNISVRTARQQNLKSSVQ